MSATRESSATGRHPVLRIGPGMAERQAEGLWVPSDRTMSKLQEPVQAEIVFDFSVLLGLRDKDIASQFLASLSGTLADAAFDRSVTDLAGRRHDALESQDVLDALRSGRLAALHFTVSLLGHRSEVTLSRAVGRPHLVSVQLPVFRAKHTPAPHRWGDGVLGFPSAAPSVFWMQTGLAAAAPASVFALPIFPGAFALDAADTLVSMARQSARLEIPLGETLQAGGPFASLRLEGEPDPRRTWTFAAIPEATADRPQSPMFSGPDWWSALEALLRDPNSGARVVEHLRSAFPSSTAWSIANLDQLPTPHFLVPAENDVWLFLSATAEGLAVGLDARLPPSDRASALAHAAAHIALGHVRPGDRWAHWDTKESITQEHPHRLWDQEVSSCVARTVGTRPARRVSALEECTPFEKAQLGLWRMIGTMLGESRHLHPSAERYQRAAYQRRAAERLASMLEDFGGAMLCDGVGLGKTYVGTTLIVHHANMWREKPGNTPQVLVEDPFRVTVLAPHAVVSTWRREALPSLASFGVSLAHVRVISHTQLSRLTSSSDILSAPGGGAPSDLEHLLLSDLVIVDEAHNFRAVSARRTKVLRDLLRIQPRRETRRRVVLLTATPINNSLEDLKQEVSLLFSRPLWLSDAKGSVYRKQAISEIRDRLTKARALPGRDVAPLLIHGRSDAKLSDAIEFRDDLNLGPNVQRIGDYINEQDKLLKDLQGRIRETALAGDEARGDTVVRIAEDLLDRIVVQRSRALCKDIEQQQGGGVELLFRPDPGAPEKLLYSDEYDGIQDVLARFLPLFDAGEDLRGAQKSTLSFKIYMWHDVRAGLKSPHETSSVIGLQRVLALKRLESSPVSFLITLLRLTVLHAHRLEQLRALYSAAGDNLRMETLVREIRSAVGQQAPEDLDKIRALAAPDRATSAATSADEGFLTTLAAAHIDERPVADTDDPPPQLTLFDVAPSDGSAPAERDRLWALREPILRDFQTLLSVAPALADIVFGRFDRREWPRRFIARGASIDWPASPTWGLRLVTDAKLQKLVGRLVGARRSGQRVVVFSQFSDTIAYVQSVLAACRSFTRPDWQVVLRGMGVPHLRAEELTSLLDAIAVVTGETEDRDEVVNSFAPFYRIGPGRPTSAALSGDIDPATLEWEAAWERAISSPIDVLLSTDVLAEGVNLQDASMLVNFDVHWNPVRMIQRAGRIDRRLSPAIEHATSFPDLAHIAQRLGKPAPRYYWHAHRHEAPATVNMILPDELEAELLLRERLATKTLAIDFTLGLERGTGAEAEWMESYKYKGIASLSTFERDRAIEQISGHHERLLQAMRQRGVEPEWAEHLNGWFRATIANEVSPLIARAKIGRRDTELLTYTRCLEPRRADGAPCWLWSPTKPGPSTLSFWIQLDAQKFPPVIRTDLPWRENASLPLSAQHLLSAACQLEACDEGDITELPPREVGKPLQQGATAIAAGFLNTEQDRRAVRVGQFFILQLPGFEVAQSAPRADRRPTVPPASSALPRS